VILILLPGLGLSGDTSRAEAQEIRTIAVRAASLIYTTSTTLCFKAIYSLA